MKSFESIKKSSDSRTLNENDVKIDPKNDSISGNSLLNDGTRKLKNLKSVERIRNYEISKPNTSKNDSESQ